MRPAVNAEAHIISVHVKKSGGCVSVLDAPEKKPLALRLDPAASRREPRPMQPWLDLDGRERGCRRCGRAEPAERLYVWTARQRTRQLDFAAPRRAGAVVRYQAIGRAHLVCADCWSRLAQGGHIGEAARQRLSWMLVALLAACALGGWLTPQLAPNVIAAFWRNGAGGR